MPAAASSYICAQHSRSHVVDFVCIMLANLASFSSTWHCLFLFQMLFFRLLRCVIMVSLVRTRIFLLHMYSVAFQADQHRHSLRQGTSICSFTPSFVSCKNLSSCSALLSRLGELWEWCEMELKVSKQLKLVKNVCTVWPSSYKVRWKAKVSRKSKWANFGLWIWSIAGTL
jgi:hypothetical protein